MSNIFENFIIKKYGSLTNYITEDYDLKIIKEELKDYNITPSILKIRKMYLHCNRDIVEVILMFINRGDTQVKEN